MHLQDYEKDGLTVTRDGAVLTARLERGEGNPVSMEICEALTELLNDPPEGAHILILAAGGAAFCTGRDRGASDPAGLVRESGILIGLNEAIEASRLVTIATRSARFSFPEAKIGLAPAVVLAWLPRLVGRRAAFWMTATAQPLAGDELLRLGLVNQLVEDEAELDAAVAAAVAQLMAHKPRNHAEIKAMLRDFEGLSADKVNRMASSRLVVGVLRRGEAD